MNCQEFEKSISDYIDGELAGESMSRFEQHRRQCSLCAILLDGVTENLALLRNLPEVDPPPGLTERILAATQPSSPGLWERWKAFFRFEPKFYPRLAVASLAVLFVIALGLNSLGLFPGSNANSKNEADLITMLDYSGNRMVARAVRVYESASDAWASAKGFVEKVGDFFQSNWRQVKDVLDSNAKKKKTVPQERKEMNQSGYCFRSFPITA